MPYQIGTYRMHDGNEIDLNQINPEGKKLFFWLMEEYEAATSWNDFQERTAERTVQECIRFQEQERKYGRDTKWEDLGLYQIRFDMLRNAGIKTGELKGELSDIIIAADKA